MVELVAIRLPCTIVIVRCEPYAFSFVRSDIFFFVIHVEINYETQRRDAKKERTNAEKRRNTIIIIHVTFLLFPQSSAAYIPGNTHTREGPGGRGGEQQARKDLHTCTIQTCEKIFVLFSIYKYSRRGTRAREHRYTYIFFGSGVGEVTNSGHSRNSNI